MSTAPQRRPTAKQLSYLRSLAISRGETFAVPRSAAEAAAEIRRLKRRSRSTRAERRAERRGLSRDLALGGDAARVRESEIDGYGSSARWR